MAVTSSANFTTGMAIQLNGSDEIMVVQGIESSNKIQVLRGAFDTPAQRSAGNDDEINVLGSVDDLVCAPNVCDIDNITSAGTDYSSCDGKQSGEVCTITCVDGHTGYDAQANTVDATDCPLVCNANGDFQDTCGLVCQPNVCDIDDITNAMAFVDYSSCHGKTTGEVCTPVCVPGTEQITNTSKPIHVVCDGDGDFVHDIALVGAVVANVARLNASLSNVTDTQVVTGGSSTGSFAFTSTLSLRTSPHPKAKTQNPQSEQQSGQGPVRPPVRCLSVRPSVRSAVPSWTSRTFKHPSVRLVQ